MNDLLVLVKLLSACYQAKKLNDSNLLAELVEHLNELPVPNSDIYTKDKETREGIKSTIQWLLKQPDDDKAVIKSMLLQRAALFCKDEDDLKKAIEAGLEEYESDEMTRRVIYKHLTEIRLNTEGEEFAKKFKKAVRDFYFKELDDLQKEDWANLLDLIQERVNKTYEEFQSEVIQSVNTNTPESFTDIIELAKKENSKEGVLKMGLQGLNEALEPDGGLRRSKFYLIEALTNRGKSFTLSHLTASVGMYNKPMLRNKAKIPTALLESAEDTLDLIIMRMYKLALSIKHDAPSDFQSAEEKDIVTAIVDCFKVNGWFLQINQIDPSKDTYQSMFARIRQMELKGHEIIFWAYDYCGLQNIDKVPGDSKSDKLQVHIRKIRSFIVPRGICFVTPHQLSPEAKKRLQESDEESEIYFIREVAGKSMTETSTKITNEVDCVVGIHVAKTSLKNYFTACLGKMRGEGCAPEKRFFIYDIDPEKGLKHDINGKPAYRRSIRSRLNEMGEEIDEFDRM